MRYFKNMELKRKRALFVKKVMAAVIAFLIVLSIAAVDRNCSENYGLDEKVIPQIRLVEEGKVKITSFIGEFMIEM